MLALLALSLKTTPRLTVARARILAAMSDIVPIDRSRIPFVHWQMALDGRDGASAIGQIVSGLDDLHQAVRTIVLTEQGTVPLQPLKCTKLLPWIDRSPAEAIPNFTREIFDALTSWEPRIVVEKVTPKARGFSHWVFPVFWYPRADVSRTIRETQVIYG